LAGRSDPVVVIGAGASGLTAAISIKRKGVPVVICERLDRIGKKVLASGNGRCNLSNERLDESFYNSDAKDIVSSVFSRFGKGEIAQFFHGLGLSVYSDQGRIFPVTNQSSSVVKVLELELKRLEIPVHFNFKVSSLKVSDGEFIVQSSAGAKIRAGSVILACGGRSYPALGSDGSAYEIARHLGHAIIEPVPAAVPLIAKDAICHLLQGQKISAGVTAIVGGRPVSNASGDLIFTKYGLSGTAVLDLGDEVTTAINRNRVKEILLSVDMVPFMSETELCAEIVKRILDKICAEDLLAGILPNRFGQALNSLLKTKDAEKIAGGLKDMRFKVTGTRGWNEADFTAGGVDLDGVDVKTLGSRRVKGLYFSGEILDVNGRRGGYNLAWAWASGYIAGESASCRS